MTYNDRLMNVKGTMNKEEEEDPVALTKDQKEGKFEQRHIG
jgi:hypothetical protein